METEHRVFVGDSREMSEVEDDSVDLVVTSPPYPMIEMWDGCFSGLNDGIGRDLENEDADAAFEKMHSELDEVWEEVDRALDPTGIVCVNIGDATRTLGDDFRLYPNHVRVSEKFTRMGFQSLPNVLWRKPTNKASKFMGSGMLPPNAYVTLEHEYVLVFRKNGTKGFPSKSERRYRSAYFWEERNRWFSDVWTEIKGELQELDGDARDRSAAYPFEIPYRLINMYSVQGDTVLDPFWGTGTTTLASMCSARNSVGYELEKEFVGEFDEEAERATEMSERTNRERVNRHLDFVEEERSNGGEFEYQSENYDFPVTTKQEKGILFYSVRRVEEEGEGDKKYLCAHSEYDHDSEVETEKQTSLNSGY